jgi:hypothetical protein
MADVRSNAHVKFTESKSSIRGLIEYLRSNMTQPTPLTYEQAMGKVANQWDPRLRKYEACIRRLVTVWGSRNATYGDAARQVLAVRGDALNIVVVDNISNVQRYASAYYKSRFFHGCRCSPAVAIQDGLKIDESCSNIGASDPGDRKIKGGGPIFLGESYSISYPYGGSEERVLRVFLDNTRVRTPLPDRGTKAIFVRNDPLIYRDHDNARAVYTMADIPATSLLSGTHRNEIIPSAESPRTKEVLRAIGSHDPNLPRETAALLNLHEEAIRGGLIADIASEDRNPE